MIFFFPFSCLVPRLRLSPYLLHYSPPRVLTLQFLCPFLLLLCGQISREDSLQYVGAACITFVPLSVILCHARNRSAVTHLGQRPVPPPISVQAP